MNSVFFLVSQNCEFFFFFSHLFFFSFCLVCLFVPDKEMSKLNQEVLEEAVRDILKYSLEKKKRKFVETIELQVGLKNYDPSKDKRFAGSMALPNECRRNLTICVLGNQIDCDKAAKIGMPFMSVEDMKALKKDKKKVKELAAKYDAFLSSESVIRQIPRLLGPGLNKAGKFPTLIRETDDLAARLVQEKVNTHKKKKEKKNAHVFGFFLCSPPSAGS